MPSKSEKQHRLMLWAAHDPKAPVPQKVAKEFVKADKRKTKKR